MQLIPCLGCLPSRTGLLSTVPPEISAKVPSRKKSSVILSEGEWEMCLAEGCCRDRAADRLCLERLESVSVISGKSDEVLRLRSDSPVEESKTFRLAPLRMTD